MKDELRFNCAKCPESVSYGSIRLVQVGEGELAAAALCLMCWTENRWSVTPAILQQLQELGFHDPRVRPSLWRRLLLWLNPSPPPLTLWKPPVNEDSAADMKLYLGQFLLELNGTAMRLCAVLEREEEQRAIASRRQAGAK